MSKPDLKALAGVVAPPAFKAPGITATASAPRFPVRRLRIPAAQPVVDMTPAVKALSTLGNLGNVFVAASDGTAALILKTGPDAKTPFLTVPLHLAESFARTVREAIPGADALITRVEQVASELRDHGPRPAGL